MIDRENVGDPELLREAAERAIRYLAGLSTRRVEPAADALAALPKLFFDLPADPTPAEDVLRRLDEIASPATTATAGGRYFGYVIGGSLRAALAAHWLASAWDQNAVFADTSRAAAALDRAAIRWILDVLSLPAEWGGAFVTGTTTGHLAALAAARHAVLESAGWQVERDGLFGAPPITVFAGERAHTTLHKALRLLGFGSARVVPVATDAQGRMRACAIPRWSGPAIVCAQAGHVDGGAFDPLPEVIAVARAGGAWVHVDAAFGLWARAAPARAHLSTGLEDVDSCAADLHKWLNVPYDSGLVLVRPTAGRALRAAMAMHASYLPEDDGGDPGRFTPEASCRARGVDAWAALLSLGRRGLADLVERSCRHARRFAESLGSAGYDVLNDVELNQVVVAFGPDDATRRVIDAIRREGTCSCSGTTWNGRAAMRISVSCWATTADDVEHSLGAILRIAREIAPAPTARAVP